jgi:hypothetical protein
MFVVIHTSFGPGEAGAAERQEGITKVSRRSTQILSVGFVFVANDISILSVFLSLKFLLPSSFNSFFLIYLELKKEHGQYFTLFSVFLTDEIV